MNFGFWKINLAGNTLSQNIFVLFLYFAGLSSRGIQVLEPSIHFLSIVIVIFYCFAIQPLIRWIKP